MLSLVGGIVKKVWIVTEALFSYGYALVESLAFIALSSLFIAWRQLTCGSGADETEEDVLVPHSHRMGQGPAKIIRIYYGTMTGTAKVI